MSYYDEIYLKRLNRFGTDLNSRLEGARRRNFETFLKQSPHYETFLYDNKTIECVFEPMRQNETKTLMHVLVRADQELEIGKIISIKDRKYMIYYWDERRNSGYNRYTVIRLTHNVSWISKVSGEEYTSDAYLYFQQDNMLKNELKSRSRMDILYLENLKLNFLVMPTTENIKIADYVIITTTGITQYFRVTGFDLVSTPGVMYVSIDPTPERDLTPAEIDEDDTDAELYWLQNFKILKVDEEEEEDDE